MIPNDMTRGVTQTHLESIWIQNLQRLQTNNFFFFDIMQTIAPSDSKFLHKRWLHSQASVDIRSKVFYDDTVDGGSGIRQEHSIYLAASSLSATFAKWAWVKKHFFRLDSQYCLSFCQPKTLLRKRKEAEREE